MKNFIHLAMLASLVGLLVGCDESPPPKATTVELTQPQANDTLPPIPVSDVPVQELGSGILVEFFVLKPCFSCLTERQNLRDEVQGFINSGKYEIVRVVTTNDRHGHLMEVAIYYHLLAKP